MARAGEAAAARGVLKYYQAKCYGAAEADRLVEMYGLEYFTNLARQEEFFIGDANHDSYLKLVQMYNLPHALLEYAGSVKVEVDYADTFHKSGDKRVKSECIYRHPDGRLFVSTTGLAPWKRSDWYEVRLPKGVRLPR